MTEHDLRDYVFQLVKNHGGKKAKEMLSNEIDKSDDLMVAFAKYGAKIMDALAESENSVIN